jgi:hypothetical protein
VTPAQSYPSVDESRPPAPPADEPVVVEVGNQGILLDGRADWAEYPTTGCLRRRRGVAHLGAPPLPSRRRFNSGRTGPMNLTVVSLSLEGGTQPHAGEDFKLRVELNQPVPASAGGVPVFLEKQRVVANLGGFPELRPTGANYFDKDPKPIPIKTGEKVGLSDPIRVKLMPQGSEGDPPVVLPESLLFSGFLVELKAGFRACVVLILPPGPKR